MNRADLYSGYSRGKPRGLRNFSYSNLPARQPKTQRKWKNFILRPGCELRTLFSGKNIKNFYWLNPISAIQATVKRNPQQLSAG